MEVILLERIGKLGQMGEVVRVKDGFARNFLLPRGKALRATAANKSRFDTMKVDLEARNLVLKSEAEKIGKKLDRTEWTMTPPTVNAYYTSTRNSITFPAGSFT